MTEPTRRSPQPEGTGRNPRDHRSAATGSPAIGHPDEPAGPDAPGAPAMPPGASRTPRGVHFLPWVAAEPAAARAGTPARPARRAPVPPRDLLAAPDPGGMADPLATLPPWLPPVRRREPITRHPGGLPPEVPPPSAPRALEPRRQPAPRRPNQPPAPDVPAPFADQTASPPTPPAWIPVPPRQPGWPSFDQPAPQPPEQQSGQQQHDDRPLEDPGEPSAPPTEHQPPVIPEQPTPRDRTEEEPALAQSPRPSTEVTADAIRHEQLVRHARPAPRSGWRAAIYTATGGRVNLGMGGAERRHHELLRRVRTPLPGPRHVTVSSIKGGVGKTTVAACLGLAFAEYRGDGVIAVDADPDAGTLADRLCGPAPTSIRELLADLDTLKSLSQFSRYTSLSGRLRVLASEQDPAIGEAVSREEYLRACRALARFFDILITDSGTGMTHATMRGALELSDRFIVVGTPTVDGASRASKTLDWLIAHGYQHLAENAVLVLCQDRGSNRVNRRELRKHFASRCQHVVEIPADPHLAGGGLIDPRFLAPATREAFLRLAAVVADGFVSGPATDHTSTPNR